MGNFLIVYQITLPEQQDAEAFVAFMQNEYFPAVHKGPTRVGEVTSLTLLRGVTATHEGMHTFFLHMGFGGLATGNIRVDEEGVGRKFEAFGVRVERLGAYDQVAIWPETTNA